MKAKISVDFQISISVKDQKPHNTGSRKDLADLVFPFPLSSHFMNSLVAWELEFSRTQSMFFDSIKIKTVLFFLNVCLTLLHQLRDCNIASKSQSWL